MSTKNLKYNQIQDLTCFGLAFLVLSLSIPIYAFNRSPENVASSYCLAFLRCFPDWITSHLSGYALLLKRFPFFDEGLPSAIWCFSWTLLLLSLWGNVKTNRVERMVWCLLPVVMNTSWEILQHVGIMEGSGNTTDCLFGLSGGLSAFVVRMATGKFQEVIL